MEIGSRDVVAIEFLERSPLQQKLTEMYKVAKKSTPPTPPTSSGLGEAKSLSKTVKTLLYQRPSEVVNSRRLLPNPALVKPKPQVEDHSSADSPMSLLLCRASTMFTHQSLHEKNLEVQNLYERLDQNLSLLPPPSLQLVKRELLSPSSCVTNDTDSVESLATAHANLMGFKCFQTSSASPPYALDVAGEFLQPFPVASEASEPLPEQVASAPLMTALVMIQESFKPSSSADVVITGVVESSEKLITSPDMVEGTGFGSSLFSSDTDEADLHPDDLGIVQTPEPPAAAGKPSRKLMTALHMIPEKLDPMEVDIGCGQSSRAPLQSPGLKPVLLRVKSEPVEAFPEHEPLAFQNDRLVTDEILDSPLEANRIGVFPHQEAHSSSDSEDDSEERVGTASRSSQKEFKPRNTNPGLRIQGGRLYDSEFGKTCHWCRQKTVEPHVKCRECTIYYCGPCLMNRNGENIREELCEGVRWLCPKCRNGCGPGCENCCNCGPCRKALGKPPTGIIKGVARSAGFNNAHDYLVYLITGESPEEIARRKLDQDWTNGGKFECKDTSGTSESGDGTSSSSEGSDEFTLNEETSFQLHQGTLDMKYLRKFVQSQKRKSVTMRASLSAKWSHVEPSPVIRRRDVDSIVSRLKVTGQSLSKEKKDVVKPCNLRVKQKLETLENRFENNSSIRIRESEMRPWACKRENVELNDGSNFSGWRLEATPVAKRRKQDWNQLLPFSEVKCKMEPVATDRDIPGVMGMSFLSESKVGLKFRGARALNGVSSASSQTMSEQQRGMECPGDSQGTDYRMKLKSALAQPFDAQELEALDYSVRCRKPVLKLRHMRGRSIDVVTEDEGLSYLDHHQDFSAKLEDAQSPPEKLALLRGFFFWIQHSCMEGAFRPWPSAEALSRHHSGDCMESEGPDCQVRAVVLQLDEGNDSRGDLMRTFTNPVERTLETTSFPLGLSASTQLSIPFRSKKSFAQPARPKTKGQLKVAPAITYQVVLGLPAPALSKI